MAPETTIALSSTTRHRRLVTRVQCGPHELRLPERGVTRASGVSPAQVGAAHGPPLSQFVSMLA